MRVHVYKPPEDTYCVYVKDGTTKAFDTLRFRSKTRLINAWTPIEVEIAWSKKPWHRKKWHRADFPTPNFSSLVFSAHAKEALESFLMPYGELLPLRCHEESFWVLNVTNIVDALDLEKSEIINRETMADSTPSVFKHAFKIDALTDVPIFRVPQTTVSETFFTKAFTDEIGKHGLTGFGWRTEWDGEEY